MSRGAAFRGQPLLLLAMLLLGWVGVRVALWQSPLPGTPAVALAPQDVVGLARSVPRGSGARTNAPTAADEAASGDTNDSRSADREAEWLQRPLPEPMPKWNGQGAPVNPAWSHLPPESLSPPRQPTASGASAPPPVEPSAAPAVQARARGAVGHSLLLMVGLSQMELPSALLAALWRDPSPLPPPLLARNSAGVAGSVEATLAPAGVVPNRQATGRSRWSADAWVLLREDSATGPIAATSAYGRSQAGAVLRYRLAPGSGQAPQVHLRGSVALQGSGNDLRNSEVAAGLSARPISSVPIRVAAEARVSDTSSGARVRPAVYAVTELNPVALSAGARGELYLQGGYVGGDFKTAFVDGQARVERPLARVGNAQVSAGGAAWGGAQRGAARLDIGPSAAVSFNIGRAGGRLSADYRFRIAGDSRPASGPALTLYAGF